MMLNSITLHPATRVPLAERTGVLNAAYADYHVPFHMTPDQVAGMDVLYDVDLALSPVARVGGQPAGMALLSRRGARGWVSAVGVVPAWRRQGVARRIMEALIAGARDAGLRVLTLEVIDTNAAARALYRSLGFVETRELLCWRFPADAEPLPIPDERLAPLPADELWETFAAWHDQPPCWQREEPTIRRLADRGRSYGVTMDGAAAGYCLISERPDTVGILDAGINPDFGPVTAGRPLLQALAARYPGRNLTITNVPADAGLNKALAALHFLVTIRQWEMRLPLVRK